MIGEEEWRPIPGYEGLYEVSNIGRVKSLHGRSERILRPSRGNHGYSQVDLYRNHIGETKLIYHLVLESFVGPRPDKLECRHFPDQNPANNYLINISWDTREINAADRIINGTRTIGERNGKTKLTEEKVRAIYFATGTPKEIAKQFGISPGHVSAIKLGKRREHLNLREEAERARDLQVGSPPKEPELP